MMRGLALLIMGVGYSAVAHAGAGIGVTVGTGPESYLSRGAELTLWSDDGLLDAGASQRSSGAGDSSANDRSETHASAGIRFESGIGLSGSCTFNDEPDMEIETFGGGVSLALDSAQATRLFLDYRTATYTGKGILQRQLDRDEYAVGLNHALSDSFTVGGSYSSYSYSSDPARFETIFKRRQQRNLATSSVLLDMLDYGWSLSADWRVTERQTLGLFYNRGYTLFDEHSSVTTVSDRIAVGEQWSLDLSASRIVRSAGSSGNYYDLGLRYYFD